MTGAEAAAIAAVVTAAAAAGGTAYSASQQSEAADYNAKVAKRQAAWQQMRAKAEADRQAEQDRKLLAAQRARISASGLDPSDASPLRLLTETAAQANTDYRNILLDGQMRSNNLRSQADAFAFQGRDALIGGSLQATSKLASAGEKYAQYRTDLDSLSEQNRIVMDSYTNGRGQMPPTFGGGWSGNYRVSGSGWL